MRFRNRVDAGRQLADQAREIRQSIRRHRARPSARRHSGRERGRGRLKAPLDVFLVRKLGVPGHPELAMGAIAEGGVEVLSRDLIRDLGIPHALVEQVAVARAPRARAPRRAVPRRTPRQSVVRDRTVILVDDGLATGSTMEAAILALRQQGPGANRRGGAGRRARDVRPSRAHRPTRSSALAMPEPFNAVGLWYEDFSQTTDEEVRRLLEAGAPERSLTTASSPRKRRGEGRARAGASL